MIRFISGSPPQHCGHKTFWSIASDKKKTKPFIRHAWNIGLMANFFGMVLIDVIFLSIKENRLDLSVGNSQGL